MSIIRSISSQERLKTVGFLHVHCFLFFFAFPSLAHLPAFSIYLYIQLFQTFSLFHTSKHVCSLFLPLKSISTNKTQVSMAKLKLQLDEQRKTTKEKTDSYTMLKLANRIEYNIAFCLEVFITAFNVLCVIAILRLGKSHPSSYT